jgi:hypothetical protein
MPELFDPQTSTPTAEQETEQQKQEKLALLVGEGRKYATQEALAEAYLNADQFIETLKEENANLRAKTRQQEILDEQLKRSQASSASTPTQEPTATAKAAALSEEDIARIVEQQITGRETTKTREANLEKADSLMRAKFGDRAKEIFQKEAHTPELMESYKKLAETAPEKFIALFSSQAPQTQQTSTSSTVNTASDNLVPAGSSAEPGTKAFYNALRREKPEVYYSQRIQMQMLKDAENREKFYGRT